MAPAWVTIGASQCVYRAGTTPEEFITYIKWEPSSPAVWLHTGIMGAVTSVPS